MVGFALLAGFKTCSLPYVCPPPIPHIRHAQIPARRASFFKELSKTINPEASKHLETINHNKPQ